MFIEFADELVNTNCIQCIWQKITSDETDMIQYHHIAISDLRKREPLFLEPTLEYLVESFGTDKKACDKRFSELKAILCGKSK